MRVACLISGLLRSFHHNVDHLKKALSNYQVDYFIHICSQVSDDYNHPETNYQHLFDLLEPTQMIIETEILTSDNHLFKNMRKQWYKFYLINNLKNQYEKVNNFEYDLVIRIRPDVFILDKSILLETQIPNNILYGHNDEFFYGNSETMNIISKLILDFDHLLEKKPFRKSDFFELYLQQHKISLNKFKIDYKLVLSLCNIIAIAGDSGTGKTTLVSHLEKIFKDSTLKLEGDRYHKWERGHKNWEHYTHLNPEANYICKFQEDVFNLKIGNNVYQVDYDHSSGKFTEKEELKSKQNILMCGLHTLLDRNTNNLFNLRIFLDTDINLKYFWKIKRDTYKRGYSVEQVLEKIRARENDHQQYIIPQKENSDLQIRFFTDKDFNYKHFDKEPNIYLSMTVSKELKSFLNVLDNNDLNYIFSKQKETSTITFYKTQNFRPCVYELLKNQQINNLESNDYYTIIIALVIYLHQ